MKKRALILSLSLILLLFGIFSVDAAIMHQSTNFMIKVKDATGTLQNAIDGNYFIDFTNIYSSIKTLDPGHSAEEIWVSVKDGEKNLIQALSSTNKLCSNPSKPTSYTSSPTDKTKPYHYATEIQLSSGKTFQQAINDGDFVVSHYSSACYNNDVYWYDSCGNRKEIKQDCAPGYDCVNGACRTCISTAGTGCDDGNPCTTGETIQCDGSCGGGTPVSRGTNCNAEGTYACDGAGNCLGWSGSDYGSCLFGYSRKKKQIDGTSRCKDYEYRCYLNGNQGIYFYQNMYDRWTRWYYEYDPIARQSICDKCVFGLYCRKYKTIIYQWKIKP